MLEHGIYDYALDIVPDNSHSFQVNQWRNTLDGAPISVGTGEGLVERKRASKTTSRSIVIVQVTDSPEINHHLVNIGNTTLLQSSKEVWVLLDNLFCACIPKEEVSRRLIP
jgi:hypothetical protein